MKTASGFALRAAALLLFLTVSVGAFAQRNPIVLIVSQPENNEDAKKSFVDLAPYLDPAIREAGKFDSIVYKSTLPAVTAAVQDKTLTLADLIEPLTPDAAHKVARVVGALYVLNVSATYTKEGVAAKADVDYLVGQNTWGTILNARFSPPKPSQGNRPSLLEGIHGHVANIIDRLNTAGVVSAPGTPHTEESGRGTPFGQPDKPVVKPDTKAVKTDKNTRADKNAKTDKNTKANQAAKTDNTAPPGTGAAKTTEPTLPPVPDVKPNTNTVVQPPVNATPIRHPSFISTYELLIDRARRNGDVANLIIALRKAVTEKPRDVRLRRDLVQAYKDRGWVDAAREEAQRASALAPNDAALHRLIGDGMLDSGDVDGAINEYQAAVKLDPKDPANLVALGDAFLKNGLPEEAEKSYKSALSADLKTPLAYRRLAVLNIQRGNYKECSAALTVAVTLTPQDDQTALGVDYTSILTTVEASLMDVLGKLASGKASFRNGTRSRELTYKDFTAQRKRAEEISAFLDELPQGGFGRVKALYAQSAGLVVEASDKLLEYLEGQSSTIEDEANLLRLEANKQIGEAAKKLKLLNAKPK
jgi:Flp pilus assembly protein TadD